MPILQYSHYSNAIAENWIRIVKINILNSKCNLRPGDFIRTIYPAINSKFQPSNLGYILELVKYLSMWRERVSWKNNVLRSGLGRRKNMVDTWNLQPLRFPNLVVRVSLSLRSLSLTYRWFTTLKYLQYMRVVNHKKIN